MGEVLRQALSEDEDDSYWTMILNITSADPSMNWPVPEEGLLKMDLRFNKTRLVVFQDQHGNPIHSQHFPLSCTAVPTLTLPGTMNRSEYYTALHQWLRSLCGDQIPLEGDLVNGFTNRVIEQVLRRVNFLDKVVAICVQADLYRVSLEYESIEYEEYDEELYVQEEMSHFFRVVAAEEHRRFGDCSICLEGLVPAGEQEEEEKLENYLFSSPCGHFFHGECMDKWLRMSYSCPLCRFDIEEAWGSSS